MDIRINIAVLSATAGVTVGYALGRRRSSTEFEAAVADACEETKRHLEAVAKRTETRRRNLWEKDLVTANSQALEYAAKAEKALSALAQYQSVDVEEAAEELDTEEDFDPEIVAAIRVEQEDASVRLGQQYVGKPAPELIAQGVLPRNYPENSPHPNPVHRPREPYVDKSKPYLITAEDFLQGEKNYTTATLTYYENGDALLGEGDDLLDDKDRMLTVGTHLSDFGAFDGDPNTVYIRNEPIAMDIEVVKNEGSYAESVGLGGDG